MGTAEVAATGQAEVRAPRRPPLSETAFDSNRGDVINTLDNRHAAAIEFAQRSAATRGRQQVRKHYGRWIVQDVR